MSFCSFADSDRASALRVDLVGRGVIFEVFVRQPECLLPFLVLSIELLSSTEKGTIVPLALSCAVARSSCIAESQGGNIVMDQEILPLEPGPIQLSFTSSNSSNPGGN